MKSTLRDLFFRFWIFSLFLGLTHERESQPVCRGVAAGISQNMDEISTRLHSSRASSSTSTSFTNPSTFLKLLSIKPSRQKQANPSSTFLKQRSTSPTAPTILFHLVPPKVIINVSQTKPIPIKSLILHFPFPTFLCSHHQARCLFCLL